MNHDGPVFLDLSQELSSVEQFSEDSCSFVYHFQTLCLSLDLGHTGGDTSRPISFLDVLQMQKRTLKEKAV